METANTGTLLPLPATLMTELQAVAEAENRPADDLVREAVERYLANRRHLSRPFMDPAEKARAFEIWARSHPHTPPLSDDAIRRENLIRDPE